MSYQWRVESLIRCLEKAIFRSENMWDINEIKNEHYENNRDKPIFAIVQDGDTFGVYQQTRDSVAPYIKYPTAQLAASRILQLLQLGPTAPQDYPEEVGIGEIDYKSADILQLNNPTQSEE